MDPSAGCEESNIVDMFLGSCRHGFSLFGFLVLLRSRRFTPILLRFAPKLYVKGVWRSAFVFI